MLNSEQSDRENTQSEEQQQHNPSALCKKEIVPEFLTKSRSTDLRKPNQTQNEIARAESSLPLEVKPSNSVQQVQKSVMERAKEIDNGEDPTCPTTIKLPTGKYATIEHHLVPVELDPIARTAALHFSQQKDPKQAQDVTIQQTPWQNPATTNIPVLNEPEHIKKVEHSPSPDSSAEIKVTEPTRTSLPVQEADGNSTPASLKSNVFERLKLRESGHERIVPVKTAQKEPTNDVIPNNGGSMEDERNVPVTYQADSTVHDQYYTERELKERQTFTIDRVQYVRTSKQKDVPLRVNISITPKELSVAELLVQKKPESPPKERRAIVYRNEANPTEVSNFRRTLERRASDSAVEKSAPKNANTQTLSRSFLYSSLRRRARTPHIRAVSAEPALEKTQLSPRDVTRDPRAATSPGPSYAWVKVAAVTERRVMSVSPTPLHVPLYVRPPSSASSESTLEASSPMPDFATTKVFGTARERQMTSMSRSPMQVVTKSPKALSPVPHVTSQMPPMTRETQTSPTFATSKIAGNTEMQSKTKPPAYLHAAVISRSKLSPSPTSSITSGSTSELMRIASLPHSPPDSSRGSWSSLLCASLSSVTSQCDTDCLVVADARTGVIPEELSDAETDDLVDADPFAWEPSQGEIFTGRSRANERRIHNPPELKVNDATAVYATGRSMVKKPQGVLVISPPPRDESATEHDNIFETSGETVILSRELGRRHADYESQKDEEPASRETDLTVDNGCAQNYMSFYSVFVYPSIE